AEVFVAPAPAFVSLPIAHAAAIEVAVATRIEIVRPIAPPREDLLAWLHGGLMLPCQIIRTRQLALGPVGPERAIAIGDFARHDRPRCGVTRDAAARGSRAAAPQAKSESAPRSIGPRSNGPMPGQPGPWRHARDRGRRWPEAGGTAGAA